MVQITVRCPNECKMDALSLSVASYSVPECYSTRLPGPLEMTHRSFWIMPLNTDLGAGRIRPLMMMIMMRRRMRRVVKIWQDTWGTRVEMCTQKCSSLCNPGNLPPALQKKLKELFRLNIFKCKVAEISEGVRVTPENCHF